MDSSAVLIVTGAVVALTQFGKWSGIPDRLGPLVVIVLSLLGAALWRVSQPTWPPERTEAFELFAGWIQVVLSASGVYGFTRAAGSELTKLTAPPPTGAGSSPTKP